MPLARTRSTRSRSQNSWTGGGGGFAAREPLSVSDVESLQFDASSGRFVIDMNETNGYDDMRRLE